MDDYFDSALRSAKVLFLLCLSFAVLLIAWAVKDALVAVQVAANETTELVKDARADLSGTMDELDSVMQRASVAADQVAEASKEQRKQALETTKQVTLLVKDLRETAYRINGETIPAINTAIVKNTSNITDVTREATNLLHDTNKSLEPLLNNAINASADTADAARKLSATMDTVQSVAKNVDTTTANVAKTSERIDKKVEEMTRPSKWYTGLAKAGLSVAYQLKALMF